MRSLLLAAAALALVLAGCITPPAATSDPAAGTSWVADTPLLPLPAKITALEPLSGVEFGAGNDLAFYGNYAFVSTHNNGMHVIDISDVTAPKEVALVGCNGKDIDVRKIGERLIVTISSQSPDGTADAPEPKCTDGADKGGIRLVDVTIPSAPVVLSQVPLKYGSHTHTPYGDTGIVYNSAYNLASDPLASPKDHSRSEIVNISDPDKPVVDGEFLFPATSTSIGCHDILAEPHLDRAICGAISETMIWDTTDPHAPRVVSTITNPLLSIHHSAATTDNGTLLALGDEYAGVLAPACNPSGQGPTGAIWFYDISDPASPEQLGYVPPPAGEAGTVCTAHNFNFIEGTRFLVSGFYSAGTLLIDATDPASPRTISQMQQAPTSSWASYHYRGAVFSGDGVRGLDVYKIV